MPDTIDWFADPEKLPVGTNLYISPPAAEAVAPRFLTKLHLRRAIADLFDQEQKKLREEESSGFPSSFNTWEQRYNDALADLFWPIVSAPANCAEDDDGWIKWSGGKWNMGKLPVAPETHIQYMARNGQIHPGCRADECTWRHVGAAYDIVFYRVVETEKQLEERDKA